MRLLGEIGGQDPVERLILAVIENSYRGSPPQGPPSPQQISYVLHALADHTALLHAVDFDVNEDSATSVGRWLHAYGDTIDDRLSRQ